MKMKKLRMNPVRGGKLAVDRTAGTIMGVSAMQIGPALGHGTNVDEVTIDQLDEEDINANDDGEEANDDTTPDDVMADDDENAAV